MEERHHREYLGKAHKLSYILKTMNFPEICENPEGAKKTDELIQIAERPLVLWCYFKCFTMDAENNILTKKARTTGDILRVRNYFVQEKSASSQETFGTKMPHLMWSAIGWVEHNGLRRAITNETIYFNVFVGNTVQSLTMCFSYKAKRVKIAWSGEAGSLAISDCIDRLFKKYDSVFLL